MAIVVNKLSKFLTPKVTNCHFQDLNTFITLFIGKFLLV